MSASEAESGLPGFGVCGSDGLEAAGLHFGRVRCLVLSFCWWVLPSPMSSSLAIFGLFGLVALVVHHCAIYMQAHAHASMNTYLYTHIHIYCYHQNSHYHLNDTNNNYNNNLLLIIVSNTKDSYTNN